MNHSRLFKVSSYVVVPLKALIQGLYNPSANLQKVYVDALKAATAGAQQKQTDRQKMYTYVHMPIHVYICIYIYIHI